MTILSASTSLSTTFHLQSRERLLVAATKARRDSDHTLNETNKHKTSFSLNQPFHIISFNNIHNSEQYLEILHDNMLIVTFDIDSHCIVTTIYMIIIIFGTRFSTNIVSILFNNHKNLNVHNRQLLCVRLRISLYITGEAIQMLRKPYKVPMQLYKTCNATCNIQWREHCIGQVMYSHSTC